jgi:hypothetical protein
MPRASEVGQEEGDGVTYGFRCQPYFQGLRYTNDMEKLAEGRIMARYMIASKVS